MARPVISRFVRAALAAGVLSVAAAGCVSQEDYVALQADRNNLAEQLAEAQARAAGSQKLAEGYRSQLASLANGQTAENSLVTNLQQQVANLTAERDGLMKRYEEMLGKIGTGPALPEVLTNELTEFARQNPDVVSFDAKNGIVKFKSDVTFASGDAELTPEARTVIPKFAQILNGQAARNYELRVAGHTDNVTNFSAATKQKGHKDNWYLSSHRAISVAEALMGQGVDKTRVGVTGFADQRPVASNTENAGRAQNRRVEVLILPTTVTAAQPAAPTAQGDKPADEATTAAMPEALSK